MSFGNLHSAAAGWHPELRAAMAKLPHDSQQNSIRLAQTNLALPLSHPIQQAPSSATDHPVEHNSIQPCAPMHWNVAYGTRIASAPGNHAWVLRNGEVIPSIALFAHCTNEPDYAVLWPAASKVDLFGVNCNDPVLTQSSNIHQQCGQWRHPNSQQLLHSYATPPQHATTAPPCTTCAAQDITAYDNSIEVIRYPITGDLGRRHEWAYDHLDQPEDRQRDWAHDRSLLLIGLKVCHAERSLFNNANQESDGSHWRNNTARLPLFSPYLDRTVYRILSLDNDAHCFRVRQETNDRGRTQSIYLDPNKQKAVHSALMVEGDWQILPGQWSTDPRSFDLKALQALRNRHTRVICNHNLARNTKTGLTTSDDHTTAMQWLTTTL